MNDPLLNQVEAHYHSFFGKQQSTRVALEQNNPVDFLFFPPNPDRPVYTVATRGLSRHLQTPPNGMNHCSRMELLIYFPENWEIDCEKPELPSTWAIKFLWFLTRYMIDKKIYFGTGSVLHTENNRNSTFFRYPYAVLFPPLNEPPGLAPLVNDTTQIDFCALILITQAEADFMKANGFRGLLDAMIEKGTLDPVLQSLRKCTFKDDIGGIKLPNDFEEQMDREDAVKAHYAKSFGTPLREYTGEFPIAGSQLGRSLSLLVYPPSQQRNFFTLATIGVSNRNFQPDGGFTEYARHEYVFYMPADWAEGRALPEALETAPLAVKILWLVGKFSVTTERTAMGPGHARPNGAPPRPLAPHATTHGLLVWEALAEASQTQRLTRENGEIVRLCQLLPITAAEIQAAGTNLSALISKLQSAQAFTSLQGITRPCSMSSPSDGDALTLQM